LLLLWKVQSFTSLLSYIGKIRFFIPKVKPNLILYQHACWKYLQYNTMFCKRSYSWHLFTYPCIFKLTNHKTIASHMNILESILMVIFKISTRKRNLDMNLDFMTCIYASIFSELLLLVAQDLEFLNRNSRQYGSKVVLTSLL